MQKISALKQTVMLLACIHSGRIAMIIKQSDSQIIMEKKFLQTWLTLLYDDYVI